LLLLANEVDCLRGRLNGSAVDTWREHLGNYHGILE
jgi:hypothetical protein